MLAAAAALVVLLTLTSTRYGWHRDELYFAMLDPAWGYVDQPPLVPLLAGALDAELWLLRAPATLCAAACVVLAAEIARELGGDRGAQAWTAWTMAGTTAVLAFGHMLLTAAVDLALWPLVCLLVLRAVGRDRPRLWVAAGLVAGVASYSKLLVVVLVLSLLLGLLVLGPRETLRTPWPWAGGLVALVVATPNLVYQVVHDWPQLTMGAALGEQNAGQVRWFMWVFLLVVLGPPLAAVWATGWYALLTRPRWRRLRLFAALLPVLLIFTFVAGSQPYYPTFVLPLYLAAGTVVLRDVLYHRPWWWALLAVNVAVAAVVSLPLLPAAVVGSTPIPGMNQAAGDSIGWPAYAAQVEGAAADLQPGSVVVTRNYGEAGAVERFTHLRAYSGHNALADRARPPDGTSTVLLVGRWPEPVLEDFESCEVVGHLDAGVEVDNEEQWAPLTVCSGPQVPWSTLWPRMRHLS